MAESSQTKQSYLPVFEPVERELSPKHPKIKLSEEEIQRRDELDEKIKSRLESLDRGTPNQKKMAKRYREWKIETHNLLAKVSERITPGQKMELLEGAQRDKQPEWLEELRERVTTAVKNINPPEEKRPYWDEPQ
jgi:hypothetical protein